MRPEKQLEQIERLIADYAWRENVEHKQWVIDQIIRVLYPDDEDYQRFIEWAFEYQWYEGVEP